MLCTNTRWCDTLMLLISRTKTGEIRYLSFMLLNGILKAYSFLVSVGAFSCKSVLESMLILVELKEFLITEAGGLF